MKKINFQNLPSTDTPINDTNLNLLQSNVEDVFNGNEPMRNIVVNSIRSKNLLNLENCSFENCSLINNSVKSNINNFYFSSIKFTYLNDFILNNKGKSITFSIGQAISNKKVTIVIYGTRTSGTNLQEMDSLPGTRYVSGTIANDFTSITQIELRFNRSSTQFTDTTTIVSDLMLEINTTTPTEYAPYQNLTGKENYSTGEQIIGTWTNGKPIYRKVVTFTPRTDVMETSYNHGIANIDMILPTSSCILVRSTGSFVPFAMTYPSANATNGIIQWSTGWQAGRTSINTWIGDNMRGQIDTSTYGYGAVAVLEYTKTTD